MKTHLEYWGKIDAVYWTMPSEHSMADHIAHRGVKLVEPIDAVKYRWVYVKVVSTPPVLNIEAEI